MTRRPSTFKETDVKRAVKSVRDIGLEVARVEITKAGSIILHTGEAANDNASALEKWQRDRDAS
jgi:hypothetical protein